MLHVSLLHLVAALHPLASASEGDASAQSAVARSTEREVPALFSWGDFDGDGRLDLAAVQGDGMLRLLSCAGDGRFEDVTDRNGLSDVGNAALALWADFDADGRLDLFVGARAGASRLFHNEGGTFLDVTAASGLACEGAVQSACWLDHDVDGRLDLFVVTNEKSALFHGLEGGLFQARELSELTGAPEQPDLVALPAPIGTRPADSADVPALDDRERPQTSKTLPDRGAGAFVPLGPAPTVGSVTPLMGFPGGCANSVRDQANPGTCLAASTTPTLGMLYPISANLFVAAGGNVGIGTTSPTAKLHVAGTARMTDTLTLAPSGDQALNVNSGSIYKGGALFIHTKGDISNTAVGRNAQPSVTGQSDTAVGYGALSSNTTGSNNTASGAQALFTNTTGGNNTAIGEKALHANTTGSANTATGQRALRSNTTGTVNTATGWASLYSNTTGSSNAAHGGGALFVNTTGHHNSACGQDAMHYNTIGNYNTAGGSQALSSNTTGNENTACGFSALGLNTSGARNIGIGHLAGFNLTTGNDNIAIGNGGVGAESATIRIGTAGTQTRAFVAGIRGVTTGVANAIPVLVDGAGQLGTVSSSRRFKQDIADMGERTERLLGLRPVVFHYKQEQVLPNGGEVPLEYGLIAEEVAEVFPDLVVYDDQGEPFTVKYHLLSSMLLNELQDQAHELDDLRARTEAREQDLELQLERLRADLATLQEGCRSNSASRGAR